MRNKTAPKNSKMSERKNSNRKKRNSMIKTCIEYNLSNIAKILPPPLVDNLPPQVTCPATVTVTRSAGTCDAVASFSNATVVDNCSGVTVVYSRPSGSTFIGGVTVVTVTATDSASNQAQCQFNVVNPCCSSICRSSTGEAFCCPNHFVDF